MWRTLDSVPMLDRVFDDVMRAGFGAATTRVRAFSPDIDVLSNDHEVVFVCDVPGLKREDIELTVEKRILALKGNRQFEGKESDRAILGRSYGTFSRSFALPEDADENNLVADLSDGVLTVRIPKQPKAQPRKITIGRPSA